MQVWPVAPKMPASAPTRPVEVGVGEDDVRATCRRAPASPARGCAPAVAAISRPTPGLPVKLILSTPVLRGQRPADLAGAGDDVDHAGGEARLLAQLGELRASWPRHAREGLMIDAVAGGERGGQLVGQERDRRVPGGDAGDHAVGLADGEVEHVLLVERDDVAVDLVGLAGVEAEDARGIAHLVRVSRMTLPLSVVSSSAMRSASASSRSASRCSSVARSSPVVCRHFVS